MSFLAWIVLGLISGFIASKMVNKSGPGAIADIVLGIVGAVVGGWLFNSINRLKSLQHPSRRCWRGHRSDSLPCIVPRSHTWVAMRNEGAKETF